MPSAGFEPAIAATEQLQIYALDRTDTGIGPISEMLSKFFSHGRSVAYVGKCGGNSSGVISCKAALPVRESTDKEKGGSFN
jgi:hypothetical protein